MNLSLRQKRKDDHLACALKGELSRADFSDIDLVHNCLPEAGLNEVSLNSSLAGLPMRTPLFINALTGGTEKAFYINRSLARVAREGGYAMAVGSQMAGIKNPSVTSSFEIVRGINPRGIIWANLGAYVDVDTAKEAIEMIGADGIQLHLNAPQELAMTEGDTSFKGILSHITELSRKLKVPVMVKEVGFGISYEQALRLEKSGIKALDVGGKGGTNFVQIEHARRKAKYSSNFSGWGITTPVALMETLHAVKSSVDVMASGGMVGSLEIAKALALGAKATGIAGKALRVLVKYGEKALLLHMKRMEKELAQIMLMTGATSLNELAKSSLVITGFTAEWLLRRGIDPGCWARR